MAVVPGGGGGASTLRPVCRRDAGASREERVAPTVPGGGKRRLPICKPWHYRAPRRLAPVADGG